MRLELCLLLVFEPEAGVEFGIGFVHDPGCQHEEVSPASGSMVNGRSSVWLVGPTCFLGVQKKGLIVSEND